MFSWDLLANAVVAGLLLGGFYAAVSLGIGLIFGLLDIANIAQPAFLVLGAYATYVVNEAFGIDAMHVYALEARDGKTFVRTEESYDGLVARLFSGQLRKTLDSALENGLRHLKAEAERVTADPTAQRRS